MEIRKKVEKNESEKRTFVYAEKIMLKDNLSFEQICEIHKKAPADYSFKNYCKITNTYFRNTCFHQQFNIFN